MSDDLRADYTCEICNREGKGTYSVPFVCTNCEAKFTATFSKGHRATPECCPTCECSQTGVRREETP